MRLFVAVTAGLTALAISPRMQGQARGAGQSVVLPKIDARVVERAQSGLTVPVFIVLGHQPQRELLDRAENDNSLYRQVAESRYRQAAERALPDAVELRQAREAAEAVLLRTRRQAFQAIDQAIGPEQDALGARLTGLGATRISRYQGINMLAAEIPASAIAALEADPAIAQVFPAEKQSAQLATSVPDLGAPAFWNAGYTGQGEAVGILDTGIRTNHPAFAGVPIVSQIFLTYGSQSSCFVDNAGSAQDQHGHGTHVAGIVASHGSGGWTNYQGVAKGIGTLYNLKIGYKTATNANCDPAEADPRDVVAALDWAVRNTPLKVFNYSFGSPTNQDDDGFTQAIDQYIDNFGLTIAIAAGNYGPVQNTLTSPGIAYNSITVGNWVSRGVMNNTSSNGPTPMTGRFKPDLAAPGTNIFSAAYNWDASSGTSGDFVSMTGTSMAAPHIAGAVALLQSAGVSSALAAKAILINTADKNETGGWSADRGWGFTNLNGASAERSYATGSLAAGGLDLYKTQLSGNYQVAATWNRHVIGATSYFNFINIYLYRADTGEQLAYSGTLQNVDQVSSIYAGPYTGEAVLGVAMLSSPPVGVSSEPYGIAFSSPWTRASGPDLRPSCALPSSIASGSQFSITCNVTNSGDLPALPPVGQLTLPDGFSGATEMDFGGVQAGSTASVALNLTASTGAGSYTIRWDMSAPSAFGLAPFAGTGNLTAAVYLALPPPELASPANGAREVSQTALLTWGASAGATSYDVYFGTSPSPPLVATTTATSYTANAASLGSLYFWRIVARNGAGASSSPTWSFTTVASAPGQQAYIISTVAGNGMFGEHTGDGGPATSARLWGPVAITLDAAGNLYIVDGSNIREVTKQDGIIRSVAGNGVGGFWGDGGPATQAELSPGGVALASNGTLYIADTGNHRVRMVNSSGTITTVAGTGVNGFSGDGGAATNAQLSWPEGLAFDAAGSLYIGDFGNRRIRKLTPDGIISTVAGSGLPGYQGYSGDGGPATSAEFNTPAALAFDSAGSYYIDDLGNCVIRKVATTGIITTIAGNGTEAYAGDGGPGPSASLYMPQGVSVDASGNVFIGDSGNERIRKVSPDGTISTVAGNGTFGYSGDGGAALGAQLEEPAGVVATPDGRIYFADSGNNVIRVLTPAGPASFSCQYQVGQAAVAVAGLGGTVAVSIQTDSTCTWGINGLPDWITTQGQGQGPATILLSVAPNTGAFRQATISVAGAAVTVAQADEFCGFALSPVSQTFPATGGSGTVNVSACPGADWPVFNLPPWIAMTGPNSNGGTGAGTVIFTVAPNTGAARSATISVARLPFLVQQLSAPVDGLRFVPVAPCRIADTRGAAGPFGGPTPEANSSRSFAVPQSGCGIPPSAQAYSLNVTVVPPGRLSYLTLWPTGQGQPFVSTLNSLNGNVLANAALVPAGIDGAVSVYVTDVTDVILDINGYFDSPSGTGSYSFYPTQPCRVADTRNPAGPFGGPSLGAGQSRDFPVPSSPCNLPSTASAYSMNMTVVPGGYLGYLTTWPTGQAQPMVSTLNSWTGKIAANAAIVPAGNGGAISVFAADATAVVVDANGYFGAPGGSGALNFYPVAPCRIADTRNPDGPFGGPEMQAGAVRSFPVPSSGCGIPAKAAAYSVNVTVVPDGPLSYLTAWPSGSAQPFVSTLNSLDGAIVANAALVPAGTGGAISVYVTQRTHVILDINGYFAP